MVVVNNAVGLICIQIVSCIVHWFGLLVLDSSRSMTALGFGPEASIPFPRRQQLKQFVVGVAGVLDDSKGLLDTPSLVRVLDGGKLTSADPQLSALPFAALCDIEQCSSCTRL